MLDLAGTLRVPNAAGTGSKQVVSFVPHSEYVSLTDPAKSFRKTELYSKSLAT